MAGGWNQAQAQFGTHKGGAGGYAGQVNPMQGNDSVAGIQRGFNYLNEGIKNFAEMRADKERLAMEKDKYAQDMDIAQQRLNLAKEDNEMAQLKYASQQKQQQFDNEMKMKEDARKQVATELKMADWKNKEEVANIYRNNIEAVTETLESGTYEDLLKSDEYQTMLSGLASVDPEGSLKMINTLLDKKAQQNNNRRASATYNVAADIYSKELPEAISMIESGKSIPEAMEGIRVKISELSRTGNVDNKAITEQLKSFMTLLKSYKKNSASVPLQSFDAEGNPVDPMMNPGAIARQVNPITGKVSTVKQEKKSILDELGIDLTDLEE